MRSMMLAFGCIVAVICGSLLVHLDPWSLLALVLALVCGVAVLVRRYPTHVWTVLTAGLLACAGLLRGASAGSAEPARLADRGWSTSQSLRTFEVVGASEPGPRCTIELRDARDRPWGPTTTVSAPPEVCPRSSGDQVAVLAPALRRSWRDELRAKGQAHDLGRGPVVWARPRPGRSTSRRALDSYWRWVARQRQLAWASTRGDAPASLVVAAGLGLRSALAPGPRDELRAAGLGHLIAVSGLHIAVAALWLQVFARRVAALLCLSPRHACVLAWLPLWAYVGLTGGAASAVRAAAMLTAVDVGTVVGRAIHGPTTLANVAAAMLLARPDWLHDPGFALSLAAMAAIVSAPRDLGVLAMSWRITWATAPLSVLYFDVAPMHGLLGNAVALPLFGLMMPAALVATVVPGPIGAAAMVFARLLAVPILDLAALLARVPAVGPIGLLCAAVVGLVLRRVLLGRPRASAHSTHPRRRHWLPPRLACVLAIGVATLLLLTDGARERQPALPSFDWIAVGTTRSRSLLVADPSSPGSACLYRPTGSSTTWRWLLELHGVHRLSRLDARLPVEAGSVASTQGSPQTGSLREGPGSGRQGSPQTGSDDRAPSTDPRTRALAKQLERGGVGGPERRARLDGCQPPTSAEVRAALRACRFRQGGQGRALARSRAGELDCRIEDRWVAAPE